MFLTLNKKFAEVTPIKLLDNSCAYREVYLAENGCCTKFQLIVYDMNEIPDCYDKDIIPEFNLLMELASDAFPKFVKRGIDFNDDKEMLFWVITQYAGDTTLTDYIKQKKRRNKKEMLKHFYNLLVAAKEISWRLNGGSHNNISTDNVIVGQDENGHTKWYLTAMNCAAESSRGQANFDTTLPQKHYRAPETLIGHYNERSDIFALGILLAYVLQGEHPWAKFGAEDAHISAPTLIKQMRVNAPTLRISEPLKSIVAKAISTKIAGRYKSIEEFAADIAAYLGYKELYGFEYFKTARDERETPLEEQSCEKKAEEEDEDDDIFETEQHSSHQPKSNVRIERVKGNGFKDVAGMGVLKSKLTRNFVDIVQNRELAQKFNITPPNGILLWGPPGTGKTFISRKLAEESGMLFSLIKPSDLGNIYIHGSQSMIADLFTRCEKLAAKNKCGVLLVFDEFDSLVPKRTGNCDENRAEEVAEFLTRLNDCAEKNIFVVATTNRIDAIDSAITRKGRMDEVIYVGLPDEEARRELFEIELRKRPHEEIDTRRIVELTNGYSSSDISFIVKECARCSFDESVKAKHLIKISQAMLEKIIAATRPSVSADELKEFEHKKESLDKAGKKERPRVGF